MLTPLSPLLRSMFELSFSMQSADVTVITLAGVDVDPVMRMMAYIYTGELTQSSTHESSEIQEIADILQVKIDLSVEKPESTPKSSKGREKQNKTPISAPPNTEDHPIIENEEIPTPTSIKSRGRPKKSSEAAIVKDVDYEDLNTSGGRSSRQSRTEVKKKDKKVEKEKEVTVLVENDVFEEEYEVEEVLVENDVFEEEYE